MSSSTLPAACSHVCGAKHKKRVQGARERGGTQARGDTAERNGCDGWGVKGGKSEQTQMQAKEAQMASGFRTTRRNG